MAKAKKAKSVPAMSTVEVDKNWQAEDDMRTLLRAEEIRADGARIRRARAAAKKQLKAVSKVAK